MMTSMTNLPKFSFGHSCTFTDVTTFGGAAIFWECDVCKRDEHVDCGGLTARQMAAEVQHRHGKGRCDR
jgi:hypothetical protein